MWETLINVLDVLPFAVYGCFYRAKFSSFLAGHLYTLPSKSECPVAFFHVNLFYFFDANYCSSRESSAATFYKLPAVPVSLNVASIGLFDRQCQWNWCFETTRAMHAVKRLIRETKVLIFRLQSFVNSLCICQVEAAT